MGYGKPGWQLWEEEMAGRVGGDMVKASGRLTGYKGDVKTSDLLIDCKYTEGQRYALSSKMWRKMSEWAMNEMRVPMIAAKLSSGREVGIMRHRDFREMWAANKAVSDSYGTFQKGVRMSLAVSEKTHLPLLASMTDGAWSEEVIVMKLGEMLRLVGVDEN